MTFCFELIKNILCDTFAKDINYEKRLIINLSNVMLNTH